jgi:hypothetical protein
MALPLATGPFVLLLVALLAFVFSIGYLAGQRAESVQAAEGSPGASGARIDLESPTGPGTGSQENPGRGNSGSPLTSPRPDPGGSAAGDPGPNTPAEIAFADPANRYTVVVFTAEDSEFGNQRAWAIHDYLVKQGYPAVRPRPWEGDVKVFVGAMGKMAEARQMEAKVRQDPGPDSGRPFYDAYVDNIGRFR